MNLPNLITVFRICLVPVYLLVFYSSAENNEVLALGIYVLAGISDVLDGYIARSRNLITKIGTVLDPLADKLMAITVLSTFTLSGSIPQWILAIFIVKEVVMIIIGTVFYFGSYKISVPSNIYGKLGTFLLFLTIVCIGLKVPFLSTYLIYITVMANVLAFLVYSKNMLKLLREKRGSN